MDSELLCKLSAKGGLIDAHFSFSRIQMMRRKVPGDLVPVMLAAERFGLSVRQVLTRLKEYNPPFWLRSSAGTVLIETPEGQLCFIDTLLNGQSVKIGDMRSKKFFEPDFCNPESVLITKTDFEKLFLTTPGDILRAYRKLSRLSQAALGEKIGVSGKNISSMENGNRLIDTETARKLVAALKVVV